jgi:tetratricopeptide (TPR) repeat protein
MAKAARRFDLAWRIFPLDRDSVHYKGVALATLGRYNEALEAFKWTLRLHPRDFYSHYQMAVCYKHLGDFDAMVRSLREARSLSRPLWLQARFREDFAEYENDPRFAEFRDEF